MEDILALVAVLALVGVFWFTLSKILKWRKEENARKEQAIAEAQAALSLDREKRQKRIAEKYASVSPTTTKKMETYKSETTKPSYTPSPTQSVQQSSNDGFIDGMLTGMLIDSALDSFKHKSESSAPSIGVSKSESSWGFDDSDSRKSVSDSMDTSSSWSSSSSSSDSWSSSSSDSGPSSDW